MLKMLKSVNFDTLDPPSCAELFQGRTVNRKIITQKIVFTSPVTGFLPNFFKYGTMFLYMK